MTAASGMGNGHYDGVIARAISDISNRYTIPNGFTEGEKGLIVPAHLGRREKPINLVGQIRPEMFEELSLVLQGMRTTESYHRLSIFLSSFGGDVYTGFGIYDLLSYYAREHGIEIIITGFGPVMSMGALVMQAGTTRQMPQNSTMLLHPISTTLHGEVNRLETTLAQTREMQINYANIVAERGCNEEASADKILALMEANFGAGTYLDATRALALGLIDKIV